MREHGITGLNAGQQMTDAPSIACRDLEPCATAPRRLRQLTDDGLHTWLACRNLSSST